MCVILRRKQNLSLWKYKTLVDLWNASQERKVVKSKGYKGYSSNVHYLLGKGQ
jgi:hypothetical protein